MVKTIKPSDTLFIYYIEGAVSFNDEKFFYNGDFLGNWVEQDSSFLFFLSSSDDIVKSALKKCSGADIVDRYEMTYEQWHGDRIEPYVIGNLLITPPWEVVSDNKRAFKKVILDPGVVFGTGKHTTTEDCLSILDNLLKQNGNVSVMDIGSGTGLLSVSAAKLGAEKVLACDYNFLAVKTTLHNVRLNSFEDEILTVQAKGEEFVDLFSDIVVANIHYDVMKNIIEQRGFLEKKWFILSGLLRTQALIILEKLSFKPVTIIKHSCPDGIWNTIFGSVDL